jgi:starch-binding outer membrane protein, SusD/RagB family
MNRSYTIHITKVFCLLIVHTLFTQCSDFIEIDPPRTDLVRETVFENDASANAAMTDIYYSMNFNGFASGDVTSLTFLASLSADEQDDYTSASLAPLTQPFYHNTLRPQNEGINSFWNKLYSVIYKANAVIEGLDDSGVSPDLRSRLTGEAKFIRAFAHFYLVNLWGDVPLVTSTSYQVNKTLTKTPQAEIYDQIITDLKEAQSLLPEDYSLTENERTRPVSWTATALLARAYLYIQDWQNAEIESAKILASDLFHLEDDLNVVFQRTSAEVIWQFFPHSNYPNDILTFYMFGTPPTWGALREELVDVFEDGDQRRIDWVSSMNDENGNTFYFASKYKSFVPETEFSTLLRVAEVYLIMAETQAQLGKIAEAKEILNMIRSRANLGETTANDQASLLEAILQERRVELFTEWGHRWLDLKRSDTINEVLGPIKPEWEPTSALYPVPEYQVLNSPVTQNPGY